MRRFASLVAVLVCLGCAPSDPGFVIEGMLAVPDGCLFVANSDVLNFAPVLDTADYGPLRPLGIRYQAQFRVVNRLIQLFNNRYPLRAEPNVLSLNYAEVELLAVDGTALDLGGLPNPFRVTTSGTITPGTTAAGTPGLAPVEVIPPIYGEQLAAFSPGRILVGVRITATTTGASTITSGQYLFPLDLCSNCLLACDPEIELTEGACLLGQDRVVTVGTDVIPDCAR
jgi:hypothetical protein